MECFYHPGTAAVGICKSCGKGVCRTCAVDLGKGLACRSRCETDATAAIHLLDSNIRNAPTYDALLVNARKSRSSGLVFLFLVGSLFFLFGVYEFVGAGYRLTDPIPLGLGFLFLVFGTVQFIRRPKIPGPTDQVGR